MMRINTLHFAHCFDKASQMNLTLISISYVLKTIVPFIREYVILLSDKIKRNFIYLSPTRVERVLKSIISEYDSTNPYILRK